MATKIILNLFIGSLLLFSSANCFAAFSVVAHTAKGTAPSGGTTNAIDTTGANLIIVIMSEYSSLGTLTDSKSNTWSPLTTRSDGTYRNKIYYSLNPTVGSGHTFTNSGSGNYPSIYVVALSGAHASSSFDQQNGGSGSGTSLATGSVTPSEDNEIIIAGIVFDTSNTMSINGGFTIQDQLNKSSGNYVGGALATLIQTSAAAANPSWSWSSSMSVAVAIATFKADAGGGGGRTRRFF